MVHPPWSTRPTYAGSMAPKWRDRMRQMAEAQRQLEQQGEGAAERAFISMGSNRAEQTYRAAMSRNGRSVGAVNDLPLPELRLAPDETVYEVLVGALSDDTFPLLVVTDRRVFITKDQPWRRWRIVREAPAADVVGADMEKRMLTGRLRVHLRVGKPLTLKVAEGERPGEVLALLRHLAAGGAPPVAP